MKLKSMVISPGTIAALGALICGALAPSEARACHEQRLCAVLELEPDDDDYGSISFDASIPAAGLRVTVIRPYPEPPLGMYLGDDGCVTFDTQFNAGHNVIWYPEAVVGDAASSNYDIRVKVFPSSGALQQDLDNPTVAMVPPIGTDEEIAVVAIPDEAALSSILAIASTVVRRLHHLPGSLLTNGHELGLYRNLTGLNASLAAPDAIRVGFDAANEKFLLAHEIGHWLQSVEARRLGDDDGYWDASYSWQPRAVSCDFQVEEDQEFESENPQLMGEDLEDVYDSSNSHGIRSAEFSSAGLTEGFGHMVASVAFNTIPQEDANAPEGIFRYYKDIDLSVGSYDDFVDENLDDLRVALDGGTAAETWGGPSRWVELQCDEIAEDGDWDPVGDLLEVTSEVDWLRFWWQFLTADLSPTARPEFWEVVHFLSYMQVNHNWSTTTTTWQRLPETLADVGSGLTAYSGRLEPLRSANGVFNDAN